MSTIKIILNKDIPNLGEEGDVKTVKRGYARNFLFPNKLALDYSKQNRKILESKKEYLEKRKLEKRDNSTQLKEKLEELKLSIEVPAGDKGRLYGTVTSTNISEELKKLEYNIDKRKIELKEHIKFGGVYKFKIHLYEDIYANMEINVIGKKEKPKQDQGKSKRFTKKNYKNTSTVNIEEKQESTEDNAPENIEEINKKED